MSDNPRRGIHWWVRRFFFAWAIFSTLWVAGKMRTRGVSDETLQFGHYGHQLLDGKPAITRETQQAITRAAILEALAIATRKMP